MGSQDRADSSLSMALGDFFIKTPHMIPFWNPWGQGSTIKIFLRRFCHHLNEYEEELINLNVAKLTHALPVRNVFYLSDHLKTYELSHWGATEYRCITCQKRFSHKSNLETYGLAYTRVKHNNT